MDRHPPIREVPPVLLEFIKSKWDALKGEWDRLHPNNKVDDHE
jgi:hypothetical protein